MNPVIYIPLYFGRYLVAKMCIRDRAEGGRCSAFEVGHQQSQCFVDAVAPLGDVVAVQPATGPVSYTHLTNANVANATPHTEIPEMILMALCFFLEKR